MIKENFETTLWLPTGAKEHWSSIMAGEAEAVDLLNPGDIIVAAHTSFADGTQVIGGVRKSDSPDYNIKFFTVLDANGKAYPNWPIDCSDHEDFRGAGFRFFLNENEAVEYHLIIQEKEAE